MAADLSQYLDVPDALLQEQMPGVDIAALKESIRKSQQAKEGTATPVTQTIKTDPTTGEQTMTVSGSVEDLSPVNPLTPTITPGLQNQPPPAPRPMAPVNPAEAYNRYTQQMESGANPNIGYHNPEKSTAYGAYGITQPQYQEIQRANPQFAGRDISTLTPQEQGQANMTSRDVYARQLVAKGVEPTEENLRMAHLLGAGGTSQYLKSGTFNPQSMAANGGEEQLRRMVEQRRAGPVAPTQAPGPMIAGTPSSDVGLTPTEQAIAQMSKTPGFNPALEGQVPAWHNAIQSAGNDPRKLAAVMSGDFPDEAKTIAQNLIVQNSLDQKQKLDAQKTLQNFATGEISARDIDKLIKTQSQEGSYVKAVLFSQLGLGELAKQEQAKLGNPSIAKAMVGNQSYLTESRGGVVVNAYDSKGKAVDANTLARINAESTPQGTQAFGFTGGSFVIPRGQPGAGQEYRQRTNAITGEIQNVITTGPQAGELYRGSPGIAQSVGTAALKLDYGVISKYREKYGTDILGALDQLRKDRGSLTPQEEQDFLNQYRFNQGPAGIGPVPGSGAPMPPQGQGAPMPPAGAPMPPQGGAVAPQRPPMPTPPSGAPQPVNPAAPPVTVQAAPAMQLTAGGPPVRGVNESENVFKQRTKDYERIQATAEEGRKKIVESSSAILADQSKIIGDLNANKRNLEILESGRTNFGTVISGQIPGERAVGELFKTPDAIRTKNVMEQVNRIAAANVKALGTNPTDRDLIFVTSNIPNESWSEKDVAAWIRRSDEAVRRTLDIAKKQVESGGTYQAPVPEEPPAEGQSPRDKARAEIERRKRENKQ